MEALYEIDFDWSSDSEEKMYKEWERRRTDNGACLYYKTTYEWSERRKKENGKAQINISISMVLSRKYLATLKVQHNFKILAVIGDKTSETEILTGETES